MSVVARQGSTGWWSTCHRSNGFARPPGFGDDEPAHGFGFLLADTTLGDGDGCDGSGFVTKKKGPTKKIRIKMPVIPEPAPKTRFALNWTGEGPTMFFGPDRRIIHECGDCGAPLIVGSKTSQLQDVVISWKCGAYNEPLGGR